MGYVLVTTKMGLKPKKDIFENPGHSSNHSMPGMLNSIRGFWLQRSQCLSKMIA